jgi:tight adherence protein B
MTLTLLAMGLAVLVWPAPPRSEPRERRLIQTARLAGPSTVQPARRWRAPAVSAPAAILLVSAVVAAVAYAWQGAAPGVACGVTAGAAVGSVLRARARRALRMRDRDLSAALRLLRTELDSGARPASAVAAAATVAGDLRPVFERAAVAEQNGDDVVGAVVGTAMPVPRELLSMLHAWRLAGSTGAPLADVLARVDTDVQARRAQARAVASSLAGPRSSAALLAGLPVLGIALGAAMGAHPLAVLFHSSGGRLLLVGGVLLDVAGVAWTSRMITMAER